MFQEFQRAQWNLIFLNPTKTLRSHRRVVNISFVYFKTGSHLKKRFCENSHFERYVSLIEELICIQHVYVCNKLLTNTQ